MLWHTTSRIEQIVALRILDRFTLSICHLRLLHEPRTFCIDILILLFTVTLGRVWSTKSLFGHFQRLHLAIKRNHILIELDIIHARVAPHEPCLTFLVNHNSRVSMIPTAILIEWLADGITERTCGRICHCHANSHSIGKARMGTDIPIKLAIALNALACPGTVISPRETLQSER